MKHIWDTVVKMKFIGTWGKRLWVGLFVVVCMILLAVGLLGRSKKAESEQEDVGVEAEIPVIEIESEDPEEPEEPEKQAMELLHIYQTIEVDGKTIKVQDFVPGESVEIVKVDGENVERITTLDYQLDYNDAERICLKVLAEPLMGYPAFVLSYDWGGSEMPQAAYYGIVEDEVVWLGESWGENPDTSNFIVDLNQDGVNELICNVTYGGDGAERVFIYFRDGDLVYKISDWWLNDVTQEEYDDHGVWTYYSRYVPDEKVVECFYWKDSENGFFSKKYEVDIEKIAQEIRENPAEYRDEFINLAGVGKTRDTEHIFVGVENAADNERTNAYRAALKQLKKEKLFPDGSEMELDTDNEFFYRISDMDGDGHEELAISFPNAVNSSGMGYYIYDYNLATKEIYPELITHPAVTFYDNGVILSDATGKYGSRYENFCPYKVYQYDSSTDTYAYTAEVSIWKDPTLEGMDFLKEKEGSGSLLDAKILDFEYRILEAE